MSNLGFSLINRTFFSVGRLSTSPSTKQTGFNPNLLGRTGQLLSRQFSTDTNHPISMTNLQTKVHSYPLKYESPCTEVFSRLIKTTHHPKPPFVSSGGLLLSKEFNTSTHVNVDFSLLLPHLSRIHLSPTQITHVVERTMPKDKKSKVELISVLNPLTGKILPHSSWIKATAQDVTTGTVGEKPKEWQSNVYHWGREDDQAMLLAFVNAGYEPGVAITGVQAGDWILVKDAARLSATFAKDKGAFGKQALITLLASAAQGAVAAFASTWKDAVTPIIQTGKNLAEEGFKGTNEGSKRRDLYGRDPASGEFQRQEGGVVVVLPTDNPRRDLSDIYSGNSRNKKRWIKRKAERVDSNIPNHLIDVFFPVPGSDLQNMRQVKYNGDGIVWIMPWDYKFTDNAGYYAVHILVSKVKPLIEDVYLLNNLL